jgi:hypothetical protein
MVSFRSLIPRKLGRCINCLRLALIGTIAAWIVAAIAAFVSSILGWTIAAVALALTLVATAHLGVLTAHCGVRAAFHALMAVFKNLGCGCDKVPVGYELRRYYKTQQECEDDIRDAYKVAARQADDFCNIVNYKCIDEDCPRLHWVNPTSTLNCACSQTPAGWQLVCDLIYKTQCCCSPEL